MRCRLAGLVCLCWVGLLSASDGEYLFHAAGCLTCHTAEDGHPLAGGRSFETPYGVFYSPNITPDRNTGIGRWTRSEFVAALKHGRAPDGSAYFPVFPYTSYQLMTDEDAGLIYDYLLTVEPQHQPNREHELPWWLYRWMMKPWQRWLQKRPVPARLDAIASRGAYLVNALGHCGECHTPRNWAGVPRTERYLAGNENGPDGEAVPNITPDRGDGLGKWDADDLAYFLETGALPDGDYTGSVMSKVVDNTTSRLTAEDRLAIVEYLQSIPPVSGS